VFTAEERPELWGQSHSVFRSVWPEYNHHGDFAGQYFGALIPRFAPLQILVYDVERDCLLARARTIPFAWNGSLDDLPGGIDALGLRAIDANETPTALSALAAEVAPDHQRRGLSRVLLQAMTRVADQAGLSLLVAPVRPSHKHHYPLTPIEEYASWRGDDGLPSDPWIRVHATLGASILRCEPQSLRITGSVAEWQRWTGQAFPDDGFYVFPGGLAPLEVRDGTGRYWEPNVWMQHDISGGTS
jgi:GNAT superfamily N-acetyltransferase